MTQSVAPQYELTPQSNYDAAPASGLIVDQSSDESTSKNNIAYDKSELSPPCDRSVKIPLDEFMNSDVPIMTRDEHESVHIPGTVPGRPPDEMLVNTTYCDNAAVTASPSTIVDFIKPTVRIINLEKPKRTASLTIPVSLNGKETTAIIDSAAEVTIMDTKLLLNG